MFVPLTVASVAQPRDALVSLVGACCIFAAAAALHPTADLSLVIAHLALLGWVGALLLVIAWVANQRQLRLSVLTEQRTALFDRADSATQHERKKLAVQLHDDALQSMLAAQLELTRGRDGAPDALARSAHAMELAIASLRATMSGLYDPRLLKRDLAESIRAVANDRAELAGFEVRSSIANVPTEHEETLFSIARELITNVAKHANASLLTIAARVDDGVSILQVRDDGVGFGPGRIDRPRPGHIGLIAIQDRVKRLGGTVEVLSSLERGSTITIWLPLEVEPSQANVSEQSDVTWPSVLPTATASSPKGGT